MPNVLKVALPTPLRRTFDYLCPAAFSSEAVAIGSRVLAPFGSRELVGIVLDKTNTSEFPLDKLRPIVRLLDDKPIFSIESINLCQWVSDYYHHSLGEVLHAAMPAQLRQANPLPEQKRQKFWQLSHEGKGLASHVLKGSKQQLAHEQLLHQSRMSERALKDIGVSAQVLSALTQKGLVEAIEVSSDESLNVGESIIIQPPLQLNTEQQTALKAIRFHQYGTYLLDGATGSGKTEVYLQAISRVLQAGQQALVLVPEIGLTPQTLARFEQRFSVPIVQLHSNVSQKQRSQNWLAAANGVARIIIGTRLAVFTPAPKLGIIVLDEEHDLSFKQQDGLRYSARDLAVLRAHRLQIPLIMGSATPALESLHNCQTGRYHHLRLTQRAGEAVAPQLHCVDMRKEPPENTLSATSTAAIAHKLSCGEQVLVFINRRGFAPALICHHCGWSAQCRACERRLTLHHVNSHLRCHHCDFRSPVPRRCPECHNTDLNAYGKGTERVESVLQGLFPQVEIIRVDQDSMQSKNAMAELSKRVHEENPCILVGTQMLAKGHHFPKVTLAVLLDVDQALFSGDFRGAERMGQLIVQVSGRAGRGNLPGTVLLQSYQPEHPLLDCLLNQGYHRFADQLMVERQLAQLPPFSHMALLRAESKRAEIAMEFLQLARNHCCEIYPPSPDQRYLGPLPALLEKRNDRYRFQLQICFNRRNALHTLLNQLIERLEQSALASRTRWSIDVDPLDLS